jgi:hypothetical protein
VTFTRTSDVDVNSLPDPASQPPRVVSPAEALHGRYHWTNVHSTGSTEALDYSVQTDCLRTGDRCMSYFHSPDGVLPLVFGGGNWIDNYESDSHCPDGGTSHLKILGQFPLPQPLQDPITLLTGHGRQDETGSACVSSDFDAKFERTGD